MGCESMTLRTDHLMSLFKIGLKRKVNNTNINRKNQILSSKGLSSVDKYRALSGRGLVNVTEFM